MSKKVRSRSNPKMVVRFKRKGRIRSKLSGSLERPRLSVFRSNQHISVQLIDDGAGVTLAAASTQEEGFAVKKPTMEAAKELGALIGKRALEKQIRCIVFDRSGYLYHGRIKALADAVRESGVQC
jgi:large subunit ribosomal protein L18